jgi:ribonuclease-3
MNPKFTEGNIYSDIFESLIGALYLDSNYETVRDILHILFKPLLSDNLSDKDAKTLLQEYMHSKKLRLPSYSTSVIKHAKYNYLITCELLDLNIKESLQSNKVKPAEQKIARALLNKLNEEN